MTSYNYTKCREYKMVLASVEALDRMGQILVLREKVLLAESGCLNGRNTMSIPEARRALRERLSL